MYNNFILFVYFLIKNVVCSSTKVYTFIKYEEFFDMVPPPRRHVFTFTPFAEGLSLIHATLMHGLMYGAPMCKLRAHFFRVLANCGITLLLRFSLSAII